MGMAVLAFSLDNLVYSFEEIDAAGAVARRKRILRVSLLYLHVNCRPALRPQK